MGCVIGIDFGTTSFKVGVFDWQGTALSIRGRELPVSTPRHGWIEQDVNHSWQLLRADIRAVVTEANIPPDGISGVSATGTYNLSLMDASGSSLRPAILYGDERVPPPADVSRILTVFGSERLAAVFGFNELDDAKLQSILRVMRSSKLLWLRANEPEVYREIRGCCASGMDFVCTRLVGQPVRLAGAIELDDEIAAAFDIPSDWLGTPYATGEIVGRVSATAANETGLAEGTPVTMATGDSMCSFLGAGITRTGMGLNLAGTTDVVAVTVAEKPHPRVGYAVPHIIPGLWLVSLSPLRGPTMSWLRDTLIGATSFIDVDALAANAPPGSDGLLCLPYWGGEKGVVHDPEARGMLVGLDKRHGREHLARAVLEGIAYGVRDILDAYASEAVEASEIRLSGGGARSQFWNQIRADVLGRPIHIMRVTETGCLGAAMLAAVSANWYQSIESAAEEMTRIAQTIHPDPRRSATYDQGYRQYRRLYQLNRNLFPELAKLRISHGPVGSHTREMGGQSYGLT